MTNNNKDINVFLYTTPLARQCSGAAAWVVSAGRGGRCAVSDGHVDCCYQVTWGDELIQQGCGQSAQTEGRGKVVNGGGGTCSNTSPEFCYCEGY